ncbi:hypothetical protein HCU74_03640 [Spongiibacter sp. KMU-166]|uniref:DUF4136 domain-containing protein n=1 Tax=Spongiibacter thalassae TaxID=2721624 RepID=A0ABX1GE28_9GAMM|nr:hypothetical protein [Spongiibacter thalassae]NKI16509.1 hypothetical protein [Spongiibacter thalassae]
MVRILAVVLVLAISGCAVFDGGMVPKTNLIPYDENGYKKPNLSYSSTAIGGVFSQSELPGAAQSIMEGELFSVLESSNYFSRIAKKDDSADINIDVTIINKGNPAALIPAAITGATFYIIPSWATDQFNVVAKVERKDGLKKEYTLSDTATIVQWLPMMFVFPVKNFSVIPEVRKNMYKKVLADMKADGFFNASVETLSLAN